MNTNRIKLAENIIIEGEIITKTGLHIGGNKDTLHIGGLDLPIIKDSATGKPIIPGSSLKGRMRSLIEYSRGKYDLYRGEGHPHGSREKCTDSNCPICVVFGSIKNPNTYFTRLIVRDSIAIDDDSVDTELKMENYIDRLSGKAGSPRTLERVPTNTKFKLELVYSIFDENKDRENLRIIFESLALVEDTYLGGHGSRGYGKVEFKLNRIRRKKAETYKSANEGEDIINSEEGMSVAEVMSSEEYRDLIGQD